MFYSHKILFQILSWQNKITCVLQRNLKVSHNRIHCFEIDKIIRTISEEDDGLILIVLFHEIFHFGLLCQLFSLNSLIHIQKCTSVIPTQKVHPFILKRTNNSWSPHSSAPPAVLIAIQRTRWISIQWINIDFPFSFSYIMQHFINSTLRFIHIPRSVLANDTKFRHHSYINNFPICIVSTMTGDFKHHLSICALYSTMGILHSYH